MRIVQVCPPTVSKTFHPGGVETHVYELSKYLCRRGHEVVIYTSSTSLNLIKKKINGIEILYFPVIVPKNLPFFLDKSESINTLIKRLWLPRQIVTFFNKLSKEHDILHIHGHEYITNLFATAIAKYNGIPSVLTIHGHEIGLKNLLAARLLRKIARRTTFFSTIHSVDMVIVPFYKIINFINRYKPKQIITLPMGTDIERYQKYNVTPEYVLFLGRFYPEKGVETLVRAIPHVLNKTNIRFVIAGYGPQKNYLVNLTKKLKIRGYVTFPGKIPYNEVPSLLSRARILVAPGNAAYTLYEAACMNVPIISARLEWNISYIGNNNALFVKLGDEKAFAEAIVKILLNKELAKRLSRKAKYFIETYRSWGSLIHYYEKMYKQLLRKQN